MFDPVVFDPVAFDAVAFDADDTLWQNEHYFAEAQTQLSEILATYADAERVDKALFEREMRNLAHFGYGVKGFTLSMVETAIDLSDGHLTAADIAKILNAGKAILQKPVTLLDHVAEVIPELAERYELWVITKGDLLHQESKVAGSGLAEHFTQIEIVSEKRPETYQAILDRYQVPAERFIMIGNSMPSDVLPVIEIGGYALHVPSQMTWQHEQSDQAPSHPHRFRRLHDLGQLPDLLHTFADHG